VSAIRSLLATHSTTHLATTLSLDRRTLQRLSTRPYIRRDRLLVAGVGTDERASISTLASDDSMLGMKVPAGLMHDRVAR
jgi:hypothetical protein